nr:hypothetical protein CFP56_72133 [Quercus suber]
MYAEPKTQPQLFLVLGSFRKTCTYESRTNGEIERGKWGMKTPEEWNIECTKNSNSSEQGSGREVGKTSLLESLTVMLEVCMFVELENELHESMQVKPLTADGRAFKRSAWGTAACSKRRSSVHRMLRGFSNHWSSCSDTRPKSGAEDRAL